jgi:hypothetical protein
LTLKGTNLRRTFQFSSGVIVALAVVLCAQAGQRISEAVPYQIGGEEDAGKEFVVQLPGVFAGP